MSKIMNLLERMDEVRANSVTPEDFEKAWGMSVEEYRQRINAFSKEQDAELAAKKKREPKRIVEVTNKRTGELLVHGMDLQTIRQEVLDELGIAALGEMRRDRQRKKKGKTDLSVIDVRALKAQGIDLSKLEVGAKGQLKLSGMDRIGGAGGKASRRKGGKGPKK